MSKYRRAANVDKNQAEICKALIKMGYSVEKGHDDILIGAHGRTYWYEIKSERAVSKKTGEVYQHEKKDDQIRLENEFKGHYKIVSSLEQILDDMMKEQLMILKGNE